MSLVLHLSVPSSLQAMHRCAGASITRCDHRWNHGNASVDSDQEDPSPIRREVSQTLVLFRIWCLNLMFDEKRNLRGGYTPTSAYSFPEWNLLCGPRFLITSNISPLSNQFKCTCFQFRTFFFCCRFDFRVIRVFSGACLSPFCPMSFTLCVLHHSLRIFVDTFSWMYLLQRTIMLHV